LEASRFDLLLKYYQVSTFKRKDLRI